MLIDEGLELLTEAQCIALLGSGVVGRVGVTIAGLPIITPVNYRLIEGSLVFRTGTGSKLRAASEGAVVAFEVDDFDVETQTGWSVLAIGRGEAMTNAAEIAGLNGNAPSPWAGGLRDHYVRLVPELLTGRRIAPELPDDINNQGVFRAPESRGSRSGP
jgi:hypothetical protein